MDMDFTRICIGCMQDKGSSQTVCPHCHFDSRAYTMSQDALPPFTILNGKYLVGRELGRGGFGITYIAKDLVLERVVAVKEFFLREFMYRDSTTSSVVSVSMGVAESQEQYYRINREKFEREAKIIAQLDNLNGIVKVYDFFAENDTVYMVLEYLDGIDLKKYVAERGGKLPAEEVVKRLSSVMTSLQQLHEHEIIHRDISADNIMVLADGSLKLVDFGGAKRQTSNEHSSMVLAKKGYTPIEQYQTDGKQGPWTDVYSMAATIYYCICGQPPMESTMRIEKDEIKTPTELGVQIPKNMEAVIMKGLAFKRQDRYQSMEDFQRDLERGKKPTVKIAVVAAAVLGLAVLAGAGAAVYTGARNSRPVLDQASLPDRLDINTVFAETKPLVIKGDNLDKVGSLYLNDEKIKDLTILEQTDEQMQVTFSIPQETGSFSLRADSKFLGILPVSSEEVEVEIYDSGMKDPVITTVLKNGKAVEGDALRVKEPFTLGLSGEDIQENVNVFVNGEYANSSFKDGVIYADIPQELVDKINEDGTLSARMELYTPEKYATSRQSNELSLRVDEGLIDNNWLGQIEGDSSQIVNLHVNSKSGTETESVTDRIDRLYGQGVRFFRYVHGTGVDLDAVIGEMKQKEDLYLIVDFAGDKDMQAVYNAVEAAGEGTTVIDRLIASVDSAASLEQWEDIDKAQDALMIMFKADQAGMTCSRLLDYWAEHNIKAVCFGEESYWSSTALRSREDVKEEGLAFFCDSTSTNLENYRLLDPGAFEEGESEGVRGIFTNKSAPASYSEIKAAAERAKHFNEMPDGASVREYLAELATSGYTLMITTKENESGVANIAEEWRALGLNENLPGGNNGKKNAYIAVVKTHTDGSQPEVLVEQSDTPEIGVSLELDYVSEYTGCQFHLRSYGKTSGEESAAVFTSAVNYAPDKNGLNFVVYDETNECIVDSFWLDTENHGGEENPPLSKEGEKGLVMLSYGYKKVDRKKAIVEYFTDLAQRKSDSLIIMAVADDGTANIDADIMSAMGRIGIKAPFDTGEGFQKSYIALFSNDITEPLGNDTFSESKLMLEDYSYDGHKFNVVSEGHRENGSLAQIQVDGEELTNGLKGLHIVVYDKQTHAPVNYCWIDCGDYLRFNSISLN